MILNYMDWLDSANTFPMIILGYVLLGITLFAVGSNPGSAFGKTVIYARYSSERQRETSIEDQIRNVRIHLEKLGIRHDNALVFFDKEASGELENREDYLKVREMLSRGEVSLLACDELGRFARGATVGVVAEEMEVYGCRFVAADGYDSLHDHHGLMATMQGKMAGIANRELAHRIRRGIAGRSLDPKGADGAHPYGYSTRYCDPEQAQNYRGLGPKPMREVYINEEQAAVVRGIFASYVDGMSLTGIARDLNGRNIPLSTRSNRRDENGNVYQSGWHKVFVRKIIKQEKYIGVWTWGKFKHRKTSTGKRITHSADTRDVVVSHRPDLAIVPQELWDAAQERLKRNLEKFGFKEGQKSRGAKLHYTEEYPNSLLGGLLYCDACGSRLHLIPEKGGQGPYYACPLSLSKGKGKSGKACGHRGFMRVDRATDALCDYIKDHLLNCDDWVDAVYTAAKEECLRLHANAPDEIKLLERDVEEMSREIGNIIKAIGLSGENVPDSLVKRLQELESGKKDAEAELRRLEARTVRNEAMPTREWVCSQLKDLASIFMEDQVKAAKLFRAFFGKVRVEIVVAPGKKRGHPVLKFTPNKAGLLAFMSNLPIPDAAEGDEEGTDNAAETVSIPLAGCDKLDKLMPTIDAMRNAGVRWDDICAKLKIGKSWANRYYNQWKQLTRGKAG